jgi:hypothetical protein
LTLFVWIEDTPKCNKHNRGHYLWNCTSFGKPIIVAAMNRGRPSGETIRHNQAPCENASNNVQNFGRHGSRSGKWDCSCHSNCQEKKIG